MSQERLAAAAGEAFAAKGFHGTTTRDIAAAAGMSPAALYVHHKSKEELLYLLSRNGHDETLRLVREGAASADEPATQLVNIMRAFVLHHARSHTTARIVNYELHALTPDHYAEIAKVRKEIGAELRAVVENGAADGSFTTSDPRMTAHAILSLGVDVARWYREEGEWTPDGIADHYCELALQMVGA